MEKVDMICSNALSLDEFFDNPTMGKATVYQEWENSQNTYTNYEKVAQNGLNAWPLDDITMHIILWNLLFALGGTVLISVGVRIVKKYRTFY